MKLKSDSIQWAVNHIFIESDTDIFPKPKEIDIIVEQNEKIINKLSNIDLGSYTWGACRRFVIPKSELSYRIATQLDPIDSIFLAAIIYEYGQQIEDKRIPLEQNKVFNYRFCPSIDGYLYNCFNSWDEFWKECRIKANKFSYAIYVDISDFYNQIYHHVLENQLINCGLPNQVKKSLVNLMESVTQGVSRGIPIGPHSVHLLAEMTLIPVDESLMLKGYEFCRYSDDIVIFCNDELDARIVLLEIANILDKQQRLVLQNQKTIIYKSEDFIKVCDNNLNDNPINNLERQMIHILKKYTTGGYASFKINKITKEEMKVFSEENIRSLINAYLDTEIPNYSRIRWFFRRLSKIGTPNALRVTVEKIDRLMPALSEICQYFISVANSQGKALYDIGEKLISLLDNKIIASNEFFQISILSLFSNSIHFNHIDKIIRMYRSSSENVKRKIIFSAFTSNASAWVRELKEDYPRLDTWNKRALIIASSRFPSDEKKYYLNNIKSTLQPNNVIEEVLIDWAKIH